VVEEAFKKMTNEQRKLAAPGFPHGAERGLGV
jgi:hypothetical protein